MTRGSASPAGPGSIRPAAVAGQFYPADPRTLAADIGALFDECTADIPRGRVIALISPHAGYMYSGRTAAEAYRAVRGARFDAVVVISPSHREYFDGISVYPGSAYSTPFGDLPVDDGLRASLIEQDPLIIAGAAGHRGEHAVEVQLPFLIAALGGTFPFLPVVMGDQRSGLCRHLGSRLAETLSGMNALIVASTDLSHYHPSEDARTIDARFIGLLGNFDYEGIMEGLEGGTVEACGGGPAAAALIAAKALGADSVRVLHRCNSGDTGGDRASVVGYVSAAALAS